MSDKADDWQERITKHLKSSSEVPDNVSVTIENMSIFSENLLKFERLRLNQAIEMDGVVITEERLRSILDYINLNCEDFNKSEADIKRNLPFTLSIFSASIGAILFKNQENFGSNLIEKPPGHGIISFLQRFTSKRAFERIYGPAISDAREEYYEAVKTGDEADARKIKRALRMQLVSICLNRIWTAPLAALTRSALGLGKGE